MTNTQNRTLITAEDAKKFFGCHYCVSNGEHEEDLDLVIEQCLGQSSGFGFAVETLEDAIKLHDKTLKQHCQNVINRYEKFAESLKGKIFYKLYHLGLLKKSRILVVDNYLNIVDNARTILISGKEPIIKKFSEAPNKDFSIPKVFPKPGQVLYIVENDLNKDLFKIEQYIVKHNSVHVQDDDLNIYIETHCFNDDKAVRKHIHNHSIEAFNGIYYILGYDSKGFVNLSDAQKYADEQLLELIEQAKASIKNNKLI